MLGAADPALIAYLDPKGRWPGLQSVAMVETERIHGDASAIRDPLLPQQSVRRRPAAQYRLVRSHWQIENQLHWVLDVVFDEDQSRIRSGYADQNFAALRRFAVSLLTKDTSRKVGKHAKRLRAGWDNDYLLYLLTQ